MAAYRFRLRTRAPMFGSKTEIGARGVDESCDESFEFGAFLRGESENEYVLNVVSATGLTQVKNFKVYK